MKAGRPHLVYLVAVWRAGCHDRWDELDPPHGPPPPPRLEPEPPRCPLADPAGPPGGCCCHGAQRFGHVPWFHVHDQPPVVRVCFRFQCVFVCERGKSLRTWVCVYHHHSFIRSAIHCWRRCRCICETVRRTFIGCVSNRSTEKTPESFDSIIVCTFVCACVCFSFRGQIWFDSICRHCVCVIRMR